MKRKWHMPPMHLCTYFLQQSECFELGSVVELLSLAHQMFEPHYLLPIQLKYKNIMPKMRLIYMSFMLWVCECMNTNSSLTKFQQLIIQFRERDEMNYKPFAKNRSSCKMQTAFRHSIDASINDHNVNIFKSTNYLIKSKLTQIQFDFIDFQLICGYMAKCPIHRMTGVRLSSLHLFEMWIR